ncbi:hypothetical protein C1646_754845 [Rhizophagus diaphanus]|nr:hypothetical protein C1646_754845 [Rhizophagus diaphanus] [Rhizophagus sp. MUCL 43196]
MPEVSKSLNPRFQQIVFNLIENIKQSLNYLIIEYNDFRDYSDSYRNICSLILNNLGQVLPSELEFLNLCLEIEPSNLKIFLENSQNTFIKRLFIGKVYLEKGEDILPYIKEYIMKKKRVKYLAVFDYQDLVSLKDEVNEYKLHNVKIQRYGEAYSFVEIFRYLLHQQIITKSKTSITEDILQVEPLQLLLQKFGYDLENFGFGYCTSTKKKIVEINCKILYENDLGEPDNDNININLAFNIIENIKQNLN